MTASYVLLSFETKDDAWNQCHDEKCEISTQEDTHRDVDMVILEPKNLKRLLQTPLFFTHFEVLTLAKSLVLERVEPFFVCAFFECQPRSITVITIQILSKNPERGL